MDWSGLYTDDSVDAAYAAGMGLLLYMGARQARKNPPPKEVVHAFYCGHRAFMREYATRHTEYYFFHENAGE